MIRFCLMFFWFWIAFVSGGTGGVIMMEGELWREHRRFAIHILRDFGLGKNLMQERVIASHDIR